MTLHITYCDEQATAREVEFKEQTTFARCAVDMPGDVSALTLKLLAFLSGVLDHEGEWSISLQQSCENQVSRKRFLTIEILDAHSDTGLQLCHDHCPIYWKGMSYL